MTEVIEPAMQSVVTELEKQGTEAAIHNEKDDRVTLEVQFGENLNFLYEIRLRDYLTPSFALVGMDDDENNESQKYYRAEVYLKEGGQDYDIMGWSEAQIIHDILDQYEKHIHFIHIVDKS
ncbi:choline transporter [Providencia hangzhouensis]